MENQELDIKNLPSGQYEIEIIAPLSYMDETKRFQTATYNKWNRRFFINKGAAGSASVGLKSVRVISKIGGGIIKPYDVVIPKRKTIPQIDKRVGVTAYNCKTKRIQRFITVDGMLKVLGINRTLTGPELEQLRGGFVIKLDDYIIGKSIYHDKGSFSNYLRIWNTRLENESRFKDEKRQNEIKKKTAKHIAILDRDYHFKRVFTGKPIELAKELDVDYSTLKAHLSKNKFTITNDELRLFYLKDLHRVFDGTEDLEMNTEI